MSAVRASTIKYVFTRFDLKLPNKVTYRVSYWRYCSSRTSGNARNQNVLGINDRHTKRIENRLKHVLLSSFRASVRTAHQEQRGTADRNNCRAVVDNPLVKKVKKRNYHLHWPLIFISIAAEKRNYTYDTPLKCGVIQCPPLLVQLAFSLSHRGSPGKFAIFAATLIIFQAYGKPFAH